MATSFSPQPSFHLCPDFSIAPPPNVPASQLRPLDKPSEKVGFSRSLEELRGLEVSIWENIFGNEGLGGALSFLRNRENDETLIVEKFPQIDGVAFHINNTKRKKPVHMVTGLMWTEGAKLSKVQSRIRSNSGQVVATDPNSGTVGGARVVYGIKETASSSFDGSMPFILGIRVRKIWWDRDGVRHDIKGIAGATLGEFKAKNEGVLDLLKFIDDEVDIAIGKTIVDENQMGKEGPVTWVLP
ncbi:hypothetical protein M431DRAFT_16514 [Trichoderma harzianum CBS 226.95]|uniref:Uncharacterized protein n=1 Tax=Trichoderma harzianum CBS 226.95 TaxID=983964 RepID=A0A2T4AC75_TRIHA|nr:hypothetical protein M431DRAFT_16514 [Trichoderma harzianum CBS 226.95]PTB54538.1 hypothetical protein M431DRAFT_16514 [Trichoderma harzianum CBS 226.95]